MSLTFQRSFKLELDNVAKILEAAVEIPFASRHEIADYTSIPIGRNEIHGKVDPTILYASYGGLIQTITENSRRKREPTNFGRIVYDNDKRLRNTVTRWAIHYFLSDSSKGAPAWSFFIHEFLPFNDSFTKEDLNKAIQSKFTELSSRYVDENERTILQCYSEPTAFGKLKIIESYEKEKYLRGNASYPNAYMTAYILAEIWEAKHGDNVPAIEPSVLLENGHLATTLNLSEGDLKNCLNEMSAIGAIRQMREAPPFQVVRRWTDKFDLLRRAYMAED
jgi:hypothetical protein